MIFRAVLAFLLAKLATLVANLAWFPVLGRNRRSSSSPTAGPPASLLIPVRDEAGRLARHLPAALAAAGVAGMAEVISELIITMQV